MVALTGCPSSKETTIDRSMTAAQVLAKVRERAAFVKTLKGEGSITMEGKQSSQSGSFDVDLRKPDSVLVELSGPFGIHVGTFSLTRDRFIFYNRMENSATMGKPDGKTLESMLRVSMGFDELINAFTGEFPIADAAPDSFGVNDGEYILLYRSGDKTKEYRIDGDSFVIAGYRLIDNDGKPTMVATATRQKEFDGFTMPRLLRVIFPNEKRSITIAYDDIRLNDDVNCAFILPENVEKVYH